MHRNRNGSLVGAGENMKMQEIWILISHPLQPVECRKCQGAIHNSQLENALKKMIISNTGKQLSNMFATLDSDNDLHTTGVCAAIPRSGWWSGDYCIEINLNRQPSQYDQQSILKKKRYIQNILH